MSFDRFAFEQLLLDIWSLDNDLDIVFEALVEEKANKEEVSNAILGINQLHQLKCNKLFDMFEAGVKERKIL